MRVIQEMLKRLSFLSDRLNGKLCNKAELHSIENYVRRDICELRHQRLNDNVNVMN